MKFSRSELRLLALLATIQCTSIIDFMILMPLGPQLMRTLSISPASFTLLVSAYTLTASVGSVLAATTIDRFDRKRALQVVYLGFTIGTLWCGLAGTYPSLLIARAVTGAFGGCLGTLALSIVGDVITPALRGSAMGIVMTSFSLAAVVGVPLGLALASAFSAWEAPFLALGAFCVAVSLLIALLIPPLRGHLVQGDQSRDPLLAFKRISRSRNQQFAVLLVLVLMIGQFAVVPFISPYLVANCGVSEHDLSFVYIAGGGVTVFSGPLIGRIVDRFSAKRVLPILILLSLVPVWLVTHLTVAPLAWLVTASSLFFVLSSGRMIATQTLISYTVLPQERGGFMSLVNSMQHLGVAAGAYIGGIIVTKSALGSLEHYGVAGYVSMFFALLALTVAARIAPTPQVQADTLT